MGWARLASGLTLFWSFVPPNPLSCEQCWPETFPFITIYYVCYNEPLPWCLWITKVYGLLPSRYLLQHVRRPEWGHKVTKWQLSQGITTAFPKENVYFIIQNNSLFIFSPTFCLFCLFNSSYAYFVDYSELIWFWSCLVRNNHIWKSWKLLLYRTMIHLSLWVKCTENEIWTLQMAHCLSLAIPQSADPDMKSLSIQMRWWPSSQLSWHPRKQSDAHMERTVDGVKWVAQKNYLWKVLHLSWSSSHLHLTFSNTVID